MRGAPPCQHFANTNSAHPAKQGLTSRDCHRPALLPDLRIHDVAALRRNSDPLLAVKRFVGSSPIASTPSDAKAQVRDL